MDIKEVIKSQHHATLEMLRQAVVKCPQEMWDDPAHKNRYWLVAYHALFYAHLYLQPSEEDFQAWDHHRPEIQFMGPVPYPPHHVPDFGEAYSKEQVLAYHDLIRGQVDETVDGLDLGGESGFYWLPFSKLELQFYSMRHVQMHVGELCERLGHEAQIDVDWVGMRPGES